MLLHRFYAGDTLRCRSWLFDVRYEVIRHDFIRGTRTAKCKRGKQSFNGGDGGVTERAKAVMSMECRWYGDVSWHDARTALLSVP